VLKASAELVPIVVGEGGIKSLQFALKFVQRAKDFTVVLLKISIHIVASLAAMRVVSRKPPPAKLRHPGFFARGNYKELWRAPAADD